ncbi:hypothetical protein PG984_001569 [Apiospora sp. TS-2023a]
MLSITYSSSSAEDQHMAVSRICEAIAIGAGMHVIAGEGKPRGDAGGTGGGGGGRDQDGLDRLATAAAKIA